MENISKEDDGTLIVQPSLYHNAKPESVLCAAIWYRDGKQCSQNPKNVEEGYVVCGRRHADIIALHQLLTGKFTSEDRNVHVKGFLTSKDRFVGRKEANTIAIAAKQTLYNKEGEDLISEDLY